MTANVKVDLQGGILAVTISRADKKNALTNEMYGALADAVERAERETQIRAVLIQADGEIFTAGNDLGEFAAQSVGNGPAERHVARFIRSLANSTTPIVAAVNGKAVGIGTTMLLHCDFVLLSEDAQLITPFVNLALIPEAASSYLLPMRVGYVRAFEMFALGEPVSAQSALAWGLANRVVPLAELHSEARRMAEQIASKPAGSLTAMKRLMRDADRLAAQLEGEGIVFQQRLESAEAREAFTAFAEKRAPDFTRIVQ